MSVARSLKALGSGFLWNVAHYRPAGRALVATLTSEDEDAQTIAGMFLVRGGTRSARLIREAKAAGARGAVVDGVLDDIEGDDDSAVLAELADSDDPEVAEATKRLLDEWRHSG